MRSTISDRPSGIQWTLSTQLEDLDFADDLAVLSSRNTQLQEKPDRQASFSRRTRLNINTTKTKVMNINTTPSVSITVNREVLETVEEFTYRGSLISQDNGAKKDIKARLQSL